MRYVTEFTTADWINRIWLAIWNSAYLDVDYPGGFYKFWISYAAFLEHIWVKRKIFEWKLGDI